MTITIFPQGYASDLLHQFDKENNPERHYLTKDRYTKEEALDMCTLCAMLYNWDDKFDYDARTDSFAKRKLKNEIQKKTSCD